MLEGRILARMRPRNPYTGRWVPPSPPYPSLRTIPKRKIRRLGQEEEVTSEGEWTTGQWAELITTDILKPSLDVYKQVALAKIQGEDERAALLLENQRTANLNALLISQKGTSQLSSLGGNLIPGIPNSMLILAVVGMVLIMVLGKGR